MDQYWLLSSAWDGRLSNEGLDWLRTIEDYPERSYEERMILLKAAKILYPA